MKLSVKDRSLRVPWESYGSHRLRLQEFGTLLVEWADDHWKLEPYFLISRKSHNLFKPSIRGLHILAHDDKVNLVVKRVVAGASWRCSTRYSVQDFVSISSFFSFERRARAASAKKIALRAEFVLEFVPFSRAASAAVVVPVLLA